jgi:microcystin-dependent protein
LRIQQRTTVGFVPNVGQPLFARRNARRIGTPHDEQRPHVATPFLGEIKIVPFSFAPRGWALANGQILPIQQNQALFSLLGTTYGGNGVTTFALPDLRGRTPMHFGTGPSGNVSLGERAGEEAHTLTVSEMPPHGHGLAAVNANATSGVGPGGNAFANAPIKPYRTGATQAVGLASSTFAAGGSQPHSNLQPYLVLNFVVALQGVFPSRN